MATNGFTTKYFCLNCQSFFDDDGLIPHLDANPTHQMSERFMKDAENQSQLVTPIPTATVLRTAEDTLVAVTSSGGGFIFDSLRFESQVQVDLTLGTDLEKILNLELPLNVASEIQVGVAFTVAGNNVVIHSPGTYIVTWSVCGVATGTTNNRRRNLTAQLNRNSGTLVAATLGGGYTRTGTTGNTCQIFGDYLLKTTVDNETVGIMTDDASSQSGNSMTFLLQAGYLRVKRVE